MKFTLRNHEELLQFSLTSWKSWKKNYCQELSYELQRQIPTAEYFLQETFQPLLLSMIAVACGKDREPPAALA